MAGFRIYEIASRYTLVKNQYFGDINDYKKYSLLRILGKDRKRNIAMCWMLTSNDGRSDGRLTDFVYQPNEWRDFDPELFESLRRCLRDIQNRNIRWAETEKDFIPSASFYRELLTDVTAERQKYFQDFFTLVNKSGSDLVFFDPDNGLEIKSKPLGKQRRKSSSKYLYRDELRSAFTSGYSILVYQHFPRKKHDEFVRAQSKKVQQWTGAPEVTSFSTQYVVFFLISQQRHLGYFRERIQEVERIWQGPANKRMEVKTWQT